MMNFTLFRSNFDYGGISPTSGMSLIFKSYLSLCRWSKQYWKKSYAKRSYFNYLIYLCFHDVVQRVQLTTLRIGRQSMALPSFGRCVNLIHIRGRGQILRQPQRLVPTNFRKLPECLLFLPQMINFCIYMPFSLEKIQNCD